MPRSLTAAQDAALAPLRLLSRAEAARRLGVSEERLRKAWSRIPEAYTTGGGQGRVTIRGLDRFVAEGGLADG